jgi:hypothetical protein
MCVPDGSAPARSPHWRAIAVVWLVVALAILPACGGDVFRQFEYEEELYLALDGSVDVVINASMPALVALHGLPLDADPGARVDRARLRALFEAPGVEVSRVSQPWRRQGRRFVQVRLRAEDVGRLSAAGPLAWSTYRLERRPGLVIYRQVVGGPAGRMPAESGWDGSEIIGFRMHVPSRILYHNAPSRRVARGNIVSWEQPLRDRLAGAPVEIEVRMEDQSILIRTLTVFGGAAAAALALLAAAIWWVWKKGRAARLTEPGSRGAA